MEWIIQLPVLFFSVVVHEFSHGWMAYSRGDDTAARSGRLTLNPIPHVDPFGTVFLPLLCFFLKAPMFGWAKPVPVNPAKLRDPLRDTVRVAMAGPASNLVLALAAAMLFKATALAPLLTPAFKATVLEALLFGVTINLFLAFFNLVQVHPLDGSKVMNGLLPEHWRKVYRRHVPYGVFILLLLTTTSAFSAVILWPSQMVLNAFARIGLIG